MSAKKKPQPESEAEVAQRTIEELKYELSEVKKKLVDSTERTNLQYLLYTTKELNSTTTMEQMIDLCIERLGKIFSDWAFAVIISPKFRGSNVLYKNFCNMSHDKIDRICAVNHQISNDINDVDDGEVTFLSDDDDFIFETPSELEFEDDFNDEKMVFGSDVEAVTAFLGFDDGYQWIVMPGDIGDRFTLKLYATSLFLDQNSLSTMRLFLNLVASLVQNHLLKNELRLLASTDSLTGLLNRGGIEDVIERQIVLAKREHEIEFSIIAVDANGLKKVNDSCGHMYGDLLLKTIGQMLVKSCRTTDFVARSGGDEYIIVCPSTDLRGAKVICDRIRALEKVTKLECEELKTGNKLTFDVTVSLGMACSKDVPPEKVAMEADKQQSFDKEEFYKTRKRYR